MMSTTVILCPKRKRPRLQSESWDARRADLPRNLLRTHNIPPMGAREWLGWATVENAFAERVLSVIALVTTVVGAVFLASDSLAYNPVERYDGSEHRRNRELHHQAGCVRSPSRI